MQGRSLGVAACAAVAVLTSGALHAQAPASAKAISDGAGAPPVPDVSDIVVTAQRRSERLTDVPISVTAVSGAQLDTAGVANSDQLAQVTPGLLLPRTALYLQPFIRGVGNALTAPGADNSVALYVDGVYQPAQASLAFELNDIDQVEVLKGPQGTLFGRNAAGGAILISTLRPSFDPQARVGASYGRFDDVKLNAYVNVPVVADKIAVSTTLLYRDQDSYTRNIFLDRKVRDFREEVARGKLLLTPTESLTVTIGGGYSKTVNDRTNANVGYKGNITQNLLNPSLLRAGDFYDFAHNELPRVSTRSQDVNLHAELLTGAGTISLISSYGYVKSMFTSDLDYSILAIAYNNYFETQRTLSEELTFTSRTFGPISFVSGIYYYKDRAYRHQENSVASTLAPFRTIDARLTSEAYAGFVEANARILARLHLILGLRYSAEKKVARAVQLSTPAPPPLLPTGKTFHAATPRASLRYDLTDHSNVYFTFSKGFKSGTFNYTALSGAPVRPERVTAYELGYKTGFSRFRFSAAAFYSQYTNIQVQVTSAFPLFTLQNAASGRIYGGEAEAHWSAGGFGLDAGLAYTHARYRSYPGALFYVRGANGVNVATAAGASGNTMIRTPQWTANGTASYARDVSFGKLGASTTIAYTAPFFWAADNRLREPGRIKMNAELSFTTPGGRYRVSLWGRNITNTHNVISLFSGAIGDLALYAEPATYGVAVAARF